VEEARARASGPFADLLDCAGSSGAALDRGAWNESEGEMTSHTMIQIGSRYRTAEARTISHQVWEVLDVFRSRIDNVLYARIAMVGDPSRMKTLSVAALEDTRHFIAEPSEFIAEPSEGAETA